MVQYRQNSLTEDRVYQPILLLGRGRKIVVHHLVDNAPHGFRVEHRKRQRVEQHYKRNERNDGVGRDAEGEGVHLAVEQIGDESCTAFAPLVPFGARHRLRGARGSGSQRGAGSLDAAGGIGSNAGHGFQFISHGSILLAVRKSHEIHRKCAIAGRRCF